MFCHEGFRRSAISHPRASKFGDYQSTLGAKNQTSYMTDSGWEKIEQIREVNLSDVQTHEQPVSGTVMEQKHVKET